MLERTRVRELTWTDERVDLLREGCAEGLSASEIASRLGITRNAVIGKAHRLGLYGFSGAAAITQKQKFERRERIAKLGLLSASIKRAFVTAPLPKEQAFKPRPLPKEQAPDLRPTASVFLGKTLLDLEFDECRYPRGGEDGAPILFCGQPSAPGSSWCPSCREIVFIRNPVISDEERKRRSERAKQMNALRAARAA